MSLPDYPEIYVIRHGQTEWNHAGRWQGDLDSPLTAQGRAQARAVGAQLRLMRVTAETHQIHTSPIRRARITAELALGADVPMIEDARLREISVGHWTGKSREEVWASSGLDQNAPWLDFYAAAPEGESFKHLAARCRAFLDGLERPSVIVTHGVTSRFLRTMAMGWGLDRVAELPGGQGVIHHIHNCQHAEIIPDADS